MRNARIILGTLTMLLAGCGAEAEATVAAAADPPSTASPPVEPQHGGTVVRAGPHAVEVVPHASGEVYAHVLGDAPPPGETELTVEVPVRGRTTGRPVRMRWNARAERYEGRVRRVEIVPGPVDVVLVVGDVTYAGHVTVVVVQPAITVVVHERRGKLKFKGKGKHRGRHDIRIRVR